ncbi:hypothetical protein Tco_0976142, partial [Tanacetum coccineum]
FKEGDFPRLHINDIEDMLFLVVQNRLTNLSGDDISDFAIALRMFIRSLVIQKRVKDLQLRVESYQKKINVTKPETTKFGIRKRDLYTSYQDPQRFIYVDNDIRNRRWSTLEKKRANIMIKAIDKLLKERRLMRSLEKFVGGKDYGTDLHQSDTQVITMKMEILLEPTSNKLMQKGADISSAFDLHAPRFFSELELVLIWISSNSKARVLSDRNFFKSNITRVKLSPFAKTYHSFLWRYFQRDLIPHLKLKGFSSYISIALLTITGGLDTALDLNNLLGCLMDDLRASELTIPNLSPKNR